MTEYPDHFTQPEPINHHELKRLLCEIVEDLVENLEFSNNSGWFSKDAFKRYVYNNINDAILNGDDS